jgi:hypothetical protein
MVTPGFNLPITLRQCTSRTLIHDSRCSTCGEEAQLEELASHGYCIAAINHIYDGFVTIFPDGSHVAYISKRWPGVPSFEGEANLNQLEWHTDDILAVLDALANTASTLPFVGKMDFVHVGAFGHSLAELRQLTPVRRTNVSRHV